MSIWRRGSASVTKSRRRGCSGRRTATRVAGLIPIGLISVAAAVAGCSNAELPVVAHVREVTGDVTLERTEQASPEPATKDQALNEGNVVATGAGSTAVVEFQGGNHVALQPNTRLVIRKSGGTAAQFGAILLSGSAKASSTGQGVLLAIGTPFGITRMGAGEGTVEVSVDGLNVVLGDVSFVDQEGNEKRLGAGDTISVNLGVITLSRPDRKGNEAVALEPMDFVLLANPKQVQVKREGDSKWRAPKKREVLGAGDSVRTRRSSRTVVQFPRRGQAVLKRGTEVRFANVSDSGDAHRAEYALSLGTVEVKLDREAGVDSNHTVDIAGLAVEIQPGAKEAAVEVTADDDGSARVAVRFGRVALGDTVLEAGSTVTIENGKVANEPRPLATTQLDLHPKSSSIIHYVGAIPPIAFAWQEEDGDGTYDLEIARDRNFANTLFRETLGKNRFVYDRFGPGKYYWRVKGKGDWVKGFLSIERSRDPGVKYPRHNFIDDTGEKTKVFYQKTLPAITLRWKEVDGASKYRVKVYADGDFEKPLVDRQIAATTVGLSEGRLAEGKYYWQVVATNADGKDIKLGSMNTLEIAYDNAIVDLQIKSPKDHQMVSSRSVVTRGEVELGARLSINGKRANLDPKGRFRETIRLDKGGNQIVYRTISSDGVERYYVRNVTRR